MLNNINCIYRRTVNIKCETFILYKFHTLRLTPASLWWQVDWNFFTQDRRERERERDREREKVCERERERCGRTWVFPLPPPCCSQWNHVNGWQSSHASWSQYSLARTYSNLSYFIVTIYRNKERPMCTVCVILMYHETARLDWSKWQMPYVQNSSRNRQRKSTVVGVS
jgi:hypothetical protein